MINQTNNNNNHNNQDNSVLFFKVYRNIVINNCIFYNLRLFNNLSNNISIDDNNIIQFIDFHNKNHIDYYFKKKDNNNDNTNNNHNNLKELKPYFKTIEISITSKYFDILPDFIRSLPENVDTLVLSALHLPASNNFRFPNSIKTLIVYGGITSTSKTLLSDSSITTLIFSAGLEQIDSFGLPPTLTYLDMGFYGNKKLTQNQLPQTLERLCLSNSFNKCISNGCIPSSVTELSLGDDFNCILNVGDLPPKLLTLHFGLKYDQEIRYGVLPNSITNLVFNEQYSHEIQCNVLPTNLKILKMNSKCSGLVGNLPFGLEELYIYDKRMDKFTIPDSLKILKIKNSQSQSMYINIPKSLIKITITPAIKINDGGFLECRNLKKIKGVYSLDQIQSSQLPPSIYSVKFGSSFNQEILENSIPSQIRSISFSKRSPFNQPLDKLSNSNIHRIRINNSFTQMESLSKLNQIETIIFSHHSRTKLFQFPINLTTICFGSLFRNELKENELPPTLTRLELTEYPFVLEKGVLPNSLKYLRFSNSKKRVNEPIENSVIPSSVTVLDINYVFTTRPIIIKWLPDNIKILIIESPKTIVPNNLSSINSLKTIFISKNNLLFQNIPNYDLNFFIKLQHLPKSKLIKLFYNIK